MATKWRSSNSVKFQYSIFLLVFIILKTSRNCQSQQFAKQNRMSISSIRCIVKDPSYVRITKCILKAVNRTYKLVDIRADLLKPFEKSVQVHFSILKKANGGFKPFVFNVTLDACKYKNGKKNPVYDWFHSITSPYTNLNHPCPFDTEMIVQYPANRFVYLPSVFPEGEYLLEIEFGTYGVPRAAIRIYITLNED